MLVPLFLSTQELLIVLVVVLLLFGASAIPKLARSLGRAQGEFGKAKAEFDKELQAAKQESGAPPAVDEDEDRIRRSARDLGIDDKDMTLDEVKRAMQEKLA